MWHFKCDCCGRCTDAKSASDADLSAGDAERVTAAAAMTNWCDRTASFDFGKEALLI
jgi:hypothetical protein